MEQPPFNGAASAPPPAASSPEAVAGAAARPQPRQVKAASSKCRQLTADEALEIYRLRPNMKSPGKLRRGAMLHCKAVAPRFAVSAKTVREIWSGRSWTRVTRPEWSQAEIAARLGCWPDSDDGPETPIATPMPGLGSYGALSTWHQSLQGGHPNSMLGVTPQILQQARSMVPGMPGAGQPYDFQQHPGQGFYWPPGLEGMSSIPGAGGPQGGGVPGMGGQGMPHMGNYNALLGGGGYAGFPQQGFAWSRPQQGPAGGQFGQHMPLGMVPGAPGDGSSSAAHSQQVAGGGGAPHTGGGPSRAMSDMARVDMDGRALQGQHNGGGGSKAPPPPTGSGGGGRMEQMGGPGGQV
mmetsp:Transcript_27092/g.61810  ORF Transcript_27092/g.61810 Transcript_27092/m.61810 type:complete len:351 (-) Transcript_27092:10-1062(-)